MCGLYIHIPFCERKCFYCSFVVSIGQEKRVDEYLDALAKEAARYHDRKVSTVHIGGGTPNFLNCGQLKRLCKIVKTSFDLSDGTEWAVEVNPEGLEDEKLQLLKGSGVNRISLGIQTFNDRQLKYLGRNHDSRAAAQTFDRIKKNGFSNVNVDFMFCFPGQTKEELSEDLRAIVRLNSDHISLYSLTVEENSRFFVKKINLKDDIEQAEYYEKIIAFLGDAGFNQYEISNFARQGKESRHNMNYWKGGDYIGLGVGAHSHLSSRRFWNVSRLDEYLLRIRQGSSPEEGCEDLSAFEQLKEGLLFGLRMEEGVDISLLQERTRSVLSDEQIAQISHFVKEKLLTRSGARLRTTLRGKMVLDEISARLI